MEVKTHVHVLVRYKSLNSLIISIYTDIKSRSTSQEAAMLLHQVSAAAQEVDLLGVCWFHCDITAARRQM